MGVSRPWAASIALASVLALGSTAGAQPDPESEPATPPAAPSPQAPPVPSEAEREALIAEPLEWSHQPITDRPRFFRPDRWHYSWSGGSILEREDLRYRILGGARLMLDASTGYLGGQTHPSDPGWYGDAEVREARIFVQGEAFQRIFYRLEYDFAQGGAPGDMYLGVRRVGRLGTLLFGTFTEPFSLEQATSRGNLLFMERSLANVLSPKQATGVMATNTLFGRKLRWAASLTGATRVLDSTDQISSGFNGSVDLTLRANWVPWFELEGRRVLELGISYNAQANLETTVQYRQRPESNLAPALLETENILDITAINRSGLEFAYVRDSFSVQGEFLGNWIARGSGQPNLQFLGGYLQASYFLTGEHRVYGRQSGVFGRVAPNTPFQRGTPALGAVEVGVRVSYAGLNDQDIQGGEELNLGFAINWYPVNFVRFSVNAIYGHLFDLGNVGILQTRFQVEF